MLRGADRDAAIHCAGADTPVGAVPQPNTAVGPTDVTWSGIRRWDAVCPDTMCRPLGLRGCWSRIEPLEAASAVR